MYLLFMLTNFEYHAAKFLSNFNRTRKVLALRAAERPQRVGAPHEQPGIRDVPRKFLLVRCIDSVILRRARRHGAGHQGLDGPLDEIPEVEGHHLNLELAGLDLCLTGRSSHPTIRLLQPQ